MNKKQKKTRTAKKKSAPEEVDLSARSSISGRTLRVLPMRVDLCINTDAPDKWVLVDLETLGACYQADASVPHHVRLRPISRERFEELCKTCAWIRRKVLDKLEPENQEPKKEEA